MSKPELCEAFEIVLTPEQLQELGRLTAIWSQIDGQIVRALSLILEIEEQKVESLVESSMTGSRLTMLQKNVQKIKEPKAAAVAKTFLKNMDRLLGKRNHLTHGIWGLDVKTKTNKARRASFFSKNKGKPIYAADLKKLADECLIEARRINTVIAYLTNIWPEAGRPPVLYVADGPPTPRPPERVD